MSIPPSLLATGERIHIGEKLRAEAITLRTDNGAVVGAIHENCEIELLLSGADAFRHKNLLAQLSFRARLKTQ